ncbi:MAG TPA: alkaline phosphatase family protein [Vicinamibacteria bacterium]|nr:alkaline phosphatase family protein [Vicinamibacteria bacterium]
MKRFAGLLFLSLSCACSKPPVKVVLLGFDGAGWDTIEPLIDAGKLPYLERIRAGSAWGPLATFKPTKSPVIWTSIATGKTMAKHGILDFVYLEKNEIPIPYDNSERREPSIWQILDHAGRRSVIVNWFVTHPPDPIEGVMVSNRFRRTLLLGKERWDGMRDTVHPSERFDELARFVDTRFDELRSERGLPDLLDRYGAEAVKAPVVEDYPVYVMQEALIENVARHLYETESFDFFAAYFRLPDILQHSAVHLVGHGDDEAAFRRGLTELLEPFYRYMERIIESYLSAPGHENTYFVVLSDHGFSYHAGTYDHYHVPEEDPPPSGIFLMTGPAVKPGMTTTLSVYDVAPTLLYLFGLPVGEDMDGAVARELTSLDTDVRFARYGPELMLPVARKRDDLDRELDEKTLRELESLGYLR